MFDFSCKDAIAVGYRLWFLQLLRDGSGDLALIELDPVTFGAGSTYKMFGDVHLNTSFESSSLALAGGYMWVLGAPVAAGPEQRAQIIRIPLAELGGT